MLYPHLAIVSSCKAVGEESIKLLLNLQKLEFEKILTGSRRLEVSLRNLQDKMKVKA